MIKQKQIFIISAFILLAAVTFYYFKYHLPKKKNSISISVKVKNVQSGNAYLALLQGEKKIAMDTVEIMDEKIFFQLEKPMQPGMYRIILDASNYIDLVFDNKPVEMTTDLNDLVAEMIVSKSDENKQYYEYLKFIQLKNLKIFDIVFKAKELQNDSLKNKPIIDSLKKEIDLVIDEKNDFIRRLSSKNPNSFTSRIINSYILPDYDAYKKEHPEATYKNQHEFLKEHFFDHINFNDTFLLNTDVLFNSCNNYIRNYVTADGDGYRKAIDIVLSKSESNPKVHKYFLNLFIDTFEETGWESVFTYLIDQYYAQSYCETDDTKLKDLKNKSEIIKKLSVGNKIQDFQLNNDKNESVSLYSLKNKLILLFFWKSDCEYCEKSLAVLKKLHKSYHPLGFEIVAISVDTVRAIWISAIAKNEMKWINLSDFEGFKSPVCKNLYVWRTPSFYLLDQQKKIISKPVAADQIEKKMDEYFGFTHNNKTFK